MYQPIEPDRGFRVLILQPEVNFEASIKCNLISATINAYPKYEALSYVWGTGPERRPIVVNDEQVLVTINLERALRHLRLPQESRYLWVDAVCIDQGNTLERNNHVTYMKEIYARCSSDLLWMGEDSTIIENGLMVMEKYETLMMLDEKLVDIEVEEIDALETLFAASSVWQRVWIMQEISYAPDVQLVAGHASMPWEAFEKFLDTDNYIETFGMPDFYHGPFSHQFNVRSFFNNILVYPHLLAQQRRGIQKGDHDKSFASPLVDILARFRFTRATDARDKIYALLGLAADQMDVPIDYSRPVGEVYTRVAAMLMEAAGNLDLICQGPWQLNSREQTVEGLPSWVPDFSNPGESLILFAQRGIFKATGDDSKFDLVVNATGVLKLKGHQLDTLSAVRDGFKALYTLSMEEELHDMLPVMKAMLAWMPNSHLEEGIQQGNHALKVFLNTAKDTSSTQSSFPTPTYESYWRTLMLDCLNTPARRTDLVADIPRLRELFQDVLTTPWPKLCHHRRYRVEGLLDRACRKWIFAISKDGLYCMVPPGSQANDVIAIVRGAKTPIVLRPMPGSKDKYLWVGACYVHGFMDGEGFDKDPTVQTEMVFDIV